MREALRTRTLLSAGLVTLALATAGCGSPTLKQEVGEPDSPYMATCRQAAAEHDRAVKELVYLQPDLQTLVWPLPVSPDRDGRVPEAALIDALADGKVRQVFVQARGGIGKTELGKALVAETCSRVPAFRVDLRETFGPAAPAATENRLVVAVLGQAQLHSPDDAGRFRELLEKSRWILVLDSIDETSPEARAQAFQALADVRTRYPEVQVVLLGRPSIYERLYGLGGFDAVLELPPLDCGRARSSLTRMADDDAERARMADFVKTWHLDRQSLLGQQCYYPYVATYRDIQVVQRLAKNYNPDTEMGGLQATLSQVHEAILAERLLKELEQLAWTGDQVLQAVDKMVALGGYEDGEWNLVFTVDRCLQAQGGDNAQNRFLCEKIFQSVLFERIGGTGDQAGSQKAEWKFGHQAVADLFVARWLETELARTPDKCDLVDQQADMLVGKEIAGYLVGRPHGARCLAQVTRALCKDAGFQRNTVALLYKGLPLGPQRAEFVKAAKELETKRGAQACAMQTLGAL